MFAPSRARNSRSTWTSTWLVILGLDNIQKAKQFIPIDRLQSMEQHVFHTRNSLITIFLHLVNNSAFNIVLQKPILPYKHGVCIMDQLTKDRLPPTLEAADGVRYLHQRCTQKLIFSTLPPMRATGRAPAGNVRFHFSEWQGDVFSGL